MSESKYRKVEKRRFRRAVAWLLRELVRDFNALIKEGIRQ